MIMAGGLGIIALFYIMVVMIASVALILAYRRKKDPLKWYRIRVLWLYIIFPIVGVISNNGLLVSMVFLVFPFHIILWCVGIKLWFCNYTNKI